MSPHDPPGRRRILSDQEIDLWLQVTRDMAPLPGRTLPAKAAPAPDAPAPRRAAPPAVGPAPIPPAAPARPAPPPLTALDRRQRQRIARGRIEIEAAIDLHGMDQGRAHHALNVFLARAQADGSKLVLVVTGKGRQAAASGREPGILRRMVPHWLGLPELRAVVLGFEEASGAHGGAGALYVRLRRVDRHRLQRP